MSKRFHWTGALACVMVTLLAVAPVAAQSWPAWDPPRVAPEAKPSLEATAGGNSTGISPVNVTCKNLTSGQVVHIPLGGLASWDCEAAGLVVDPGDRVRQRIRGNASQVISGSIVDWPESGPIMPIGDGLHDVHAWWSINTFDKGWFYGSSFTVDSDVAHAVGVTDVSAITDASTYSFSTTSVGPFCDADCDPDGVGEFLVWRNTEGFYGALRLDDIFVDDIMVPIADLDGTWWFQPDGSANLADSVVGGGVTTLDIRRVRCDNRSTGQVLDLFPAMAEWDCEAGGLIVSSGDRIAMTVDAVAP